MCVFASWLLERNNMSTSSLPVISFLFWYQTDWSVFFSCYRMRCRCLVMTGGLSHITKKRDLGDGVSSSSSSSHFSHFPLPTQVFSYLRISHSSTSSCRPEKRSKASLSPSLLPECLSLSDSCLSPNMSQMILTWNALLWSLSFPQWLQWRWEWDGRKFELASRHKSRNDRVWDKFVLSLLVLQRNLGVRDFQKKDVRELRERRWWWVERVKLSDDGRWWVAWEKENQCQGDRIFLSLSLPTKLHLKRLKFCVMMSGVGLPFLLSSTF